MTISLPHACQQMVAAVNEPSLPIRYISKRREYCIDYDDPGIIQLIEFCPFCGDELPPSLRTEWFDRVEALGLEPFTSDIPADLRDDRWWREAIRNHEPLSTSNELITDGLPAPLPEQSTVADRLMTQYLPHGCAQMVRLVGDETLPIRYISQHREYGIDYADRDSIQVIAFCPFCGDELPPSLREAWFDRLDTLGLEPNSPEIPAAMRDDQWWLEAN